MKKLLLLLLLSFGFIGSAYSDDCYMEYLLAYNSNNYDNAIKICKPLAQSGDLGAQETLADIYYKTMKEEVTDNKERYNKNNTLHGGKIGLACGNNNNPHRLML